MVSSGPLQVSLQTPRCYVNGTFLFLFKLCSQFFCIFLKVSVPVRLSRRLAANLLGHDPEQLGGRLHRGVDEPGHVAAGGHRVVRIILLLDILHQVFVTVIVVIFVFLFPPLLLLARAGLLLLVLTGLLLLSRDGGLRLGQGGRQ